MITENELRALMGHRFPGGRYRIVHGRTGCSLSPLRGEHAVELAGPTCIRRLTVSFARPVLDRDRVVAGGRVMTLDVHNDELRAHWDVWLERDGNTSWMEQRWWRCPTWLHSRCEIRDS